MLDVDARQVFPSHHLLDHIPELIQEIARYLRAPEDEEIAAHVAQLESMVDEASLPEASGDAIAAEFEKYLRRRDFGK